MVARYIQSSQKDKNQVQNTSEPNRRSGLLEKDANQAHFIFKNVLNKSRKTAYKVF